MARLKLQAPWVTYYEELSLFFDEDPDVHVIYDEPENTVNMYVQDSVKAEALTRLIPAEKKFGNVALKINIIPGNGVKNDALDDITAAFKGNPIVNSIQTIDGIPGCKFTYVIFKREVVQYWNDDLSDAFGNCTTLWQDVAKRLFEDVPGIYFCTDENDVIELELNEDDLEFLDMLD